MPLPKVALPNLKQKEEAVEELISKLYKTILQHSIEGW
jgi:predicted translin family RNA/ssDNA-binding protein